VEPKSRTQKKKEALSLQELGERLVKLSSQQLEAMDLPQELFKEIQFLKTLTKHGAYRRQMQYVGALMREFDSEPIQRALEVIDLGDYKKNGNFNRSNTGVMNSSMEMILYWKRLSGIIRVQNGSGCHSWFGAPEKKKRKIKQKSQRGIFLLI
jgi:hypothetical protein